MTVDYGVLNHAAGINSEGAVSPDKLYDRETITRKVVVATGAGPLGRGALLGKITDGARTAAGVAGSPAPAGATITASPAATTAADLGAHRFVCVSAGATGKWNHLDPSGKKVGQAITGTPYVGGGLSLTITDSGTDPAVGEELIVNVTEAAASGKFLLSVAIATDGSEVPDVILLHDVDATSSDVEAIVAITGRFGRQGIIFGAGHTAASVNELLRDKNIILENIIG